MKAVAIIEMPEDCEDCPFLNSNNFCDLLDDYAFPNEWVEDAPYYSLKEKGSCPLRSLPNKWYEDGSTSFAMGIARGFNKCIDEILGETE